MHNSIVACAWYAGTGGTGHCGDSDYDQDVFDVTFAVLEAFEGMHHHGHASAFHRLQEIC